MFCPGVDSSILGAFCTPFPECLLATLSGPINVCRQSLQASWSAVSFPPNPGNHTYHLYVYVLYCVLPDSLAICSSQTNRQPREITGSHGDEYEDYSFLGYSTSETSVYFNRITWHCILNTCHTFN
jgi:hypothetical protein